MSKQKVNLEQIKIISSIIAVTELIIETDPKKAINELKNQFYLAINSSGYNITREDFDQIIYEQFLLLSKVK